VFYKQERVGQGGRLFTLYKFRTMIDNAEKHMGPVWAARDDDRVTPVGRVLRRMHLDELPQLLNTLRGDMSLVGPRRAAIVRRKALQGVLGGRQDDRFGQVQATTSQTTYKVKYDLSISESCLLLNLYIPADHRPSSREGAGEQPRPSTPALAP
jgi:lipopolysaccharide/colanic/teichoic acid biosynthesis glycosyltransferase